MKTSASKGRYLILCPSTAGADGISALSRLVIKTVAEYGRPLDVLSLNDQDGDVKSAYADISIRIQGAGGSKARFITMAFSQALRKGCGTHIICLHLHLVPAALPLVWKGARMTTMLCGIEAWKPLTAIQHLALRRSETLIAISEHTARRFRAVNPTSSTWPIHTCHLALSARPSSNDGRKEGVNDLQLFALIVGRMSQEERYKGHDLLLEMWSSVLKELPEASLCVVGDGDDRFRLERKAERLGIESRVTFTGKVSDETLEQLYRGCAFFIMPSRHEGFGLVFLEAMRAKKACIGGIGAAEEIVEAGVTGLIVNPDRPDEVLQATLRMFREPEARERMGRSGAERFAQRFTEQHFQQRFRQFIG